MRLSFSRKNGKLIIYMYHSKEHISYKIHFYKLDDLFK